MCCLHWHNTTRHTSINVRWHATNKICQKNKKIVNNSLCTTCRQGCFIRSNISIINIVVKFLCVSECVSVFLSVCLFFYGPCGWNKWFDDDEYHHHRRRHRHHHHLLSSQKIAARMLKRYKRWTWFLTASCHVIPVLLTQHYIIHIPWYTDIECLTVSEWLDASTRLSGWLQCATFHQRLLQSAGLNCLHTTAPIQHVWLPGLHHYCQSLPDPVWNRNVTIAVFRRLIVKDVPVRTVLAYWAH